MILRINFISRIQLCLKEGSANNNYMLVRRRITKLIATIEIEMLKTLLGYPQSNSNQPQTTYQKLLLLTLNPANSPNNIIPHHLLHHQ